MPHLSSYLFIVRRTISKWSRWMDLNSKLRLSYITRLVEFEGIRRNPRVVWQNVPGCNKIKKFIFFSTKFERKNSVQNARPWKGGIHWNTELIQKFITFPSKFFSLFLFFFFFLSKISCFIIQINFSRTDILNVMIKLKTIIWKYNNNNDEKIRYMDDARKKKRKNDDKKNDDEIS